MPPTYAYRDRQPRIHPTAFVAPGARIAGDVEIGPEASVWFNAVVRGDSAPIRIGARTNVQDGAVLHTDAGSPCIVEDDCTVGHLAVVHGCRIGRGSLVGMGAIVLSRADIGEESLIAAGALVPEGRVFEPRTLAVGSPARLIRRLADEDVERLIKPGVANYLGYAKAYRAGADPQSETGVSQER
jgi:carbonic anhydrase/acetyltransferase-like protein (isoleucine patch superfamily)